MITRINAEGEKNIRRVVNWELEEHLVAHTEEQGKDVSLVEKQSI